MEARTGNEINVAAKPDDGAACGGRRDRGGLAPDLESVMKEQNLIDAQRTRVSQPSHQSQTTFPQGGSCNDEIGRAGSKFTIAYMITTSH
eukprot:2462312-Pleurochrysis_carterae.AAC.3